MTASPKHLFDAAQSRPGGAPVDPVTDPWGVRRAENLLTSLEGILSARVVTTPLGEVSEIHILAQAGQALQAEGLRLIQVRRGWDSRFWPHATAGFFAFRKQIPALLEQEGVR